MGRAELTWIVHTDLVAVSRGRAVTGYTPTSAPQPWVGWVPADLALDAFGGLVDNPWGPMGDLYLRPDPGTFTEVDAAPGRLPALRFVLADCVDLDGQPWNGCSRSLLGQVAQQLETEFGLRLLAAFEHEFARIGSSDPPPLPFSLDSARRAEPLLTIIAAALGVNGIDTETILPEFGDNQFELTGPSAVAVAAADRAVITREVAREVARATGDTITFAPVIAPGGGSNGAHIHFSLVGTDGQEQTSGADPETGLSETARRFAAGLMAHLPALTALTAPTAASYLRLQPRSWTSAFTAIGVGNREAAIRVAPGSAFNGRSSPGAVNLELRPVDATANPYLALAAVIVAGMDGLRRGLALPPCIVGDPASLRAEERASLGIERLPRSLDEAIEALAADELLSTILEVEPADCWFSLRQSEADRFRTLPHSDIIEAYTRAY